MDIKKEIVEPGLIGIVISAGVTVAYFTLMPHDAPIWPVVVISLILGLVCLMAVVEKEEKQEKAQKDRDEKLALAMHETEVRMRIEAEQKQAKA